MKFKSVSTKLNIAIIGIAFISLFVGYLVMNSYKQQIATDVYNNARTELISNAKDKIASKMRVGITNAISIANDERIKIALSTNKRELAIDSLKDISEKMKKYTNFKNIKIHLHTKENKSFLRNWKLDKHGDDLSSFRASVVSVNKEHRPLTTFEAGRAGLLLRAITPISDNNGVHLGSLEFIQGINSVVKAFEKTQKSFLLLMSQNNNIKKGKNFSFNKNKKFKNYIISQKYLNEDFLDDAKTIDMNIVFKNKFLISAKYFYTYFEVKDFKDKKLGIILLGKPIKIVNSAINSAQTLIYFTLFGILGMIITILFVIVLAIRKFVLNPLSIFEDGLNDFFLFLQGKKDYTNNLSINTDDEFGVMAKSLKENIAFSARLHEEINDLNTNLEEKVEEKTKKITTLLDNAGQGFLTFSCDLIIDEEYSKECDKLLGDNLGGKYIPDILFKDTIKQKFFQKTIIEACRLDSYIVQKSILSLLPSEIILNRRALKLEYKILENKKIMMIITNITAKKKLEHKVKKEQEVLKMVVGIISESDSFYDAKKDYENFINNFKNHIHTSRTPLNNLNEIYRIIHTFKGTFAQLYMNDIVKFLHSLESKLSIMQKDMKSSNEELIMLLEETDFSTNLDDELTIIKTVLGEEFLNSDNYFKIDCSQISHLQKKIHSVFKEHNFENKQSKELVQEVSNLSNQKLINALKPYTSLAKQLALRLEKEIYEFEIIGDKNIVINENHKPLIKSLVHLFRNSVDHGIEEPEIRLEKGKDEIGTLSCSFSADQDKIQIIISDDGVGIDKEKVLVKAIKEDILLKDEADKLSDKEIFALIFRENFSTKDKVSSISGRGVGLNAIKVEVDKLGAEIEIVSKKDVGTTFILNIPNFKQGEI